MPIPDPLEPVGGRQMIEVSNPIAGAVATSPLTVSGMSNTADGLLFYRLKAGGSVLARGYTVGGFDDWRPFEVTISFENTCCSKMLLELYEVSGMGEAEVNLVEVPLTYPETS